MLRKQRKSRYIPIDLRRFFRILENREAHFTANPPIYARPGRGAVGLG